MAARPGCGKAPDEERSSWFVSNLSKTMRAGVDWEKIGRRQQQRANRLVCEQSAFCEAKLINRDRNKRFHIVTKFSFCLFFSPPAKSDDLSDMVATFGNWQISKSKVVSYRVVLRRGINGSFVTSQRVSRVRSFSTHFLFRLSIG